jgi:hypothetical protein
VEDRGLAGRDPPNLLDREVPHREGPVRLRGHRGAGAFEGRPEPRDVGAPHDHGLTGGGGQIADGPLGHKGPAIDHHDAVRDLGDLRQDVARDQDRAVTFDEPPEERTQPRDAGGIQPVRRFVQHQDLGIPEQRGGEGEALPHPERESLDLRVRVVAHPGEREHRIRSSILEPAFHAQDPEVVAGGPPGMEPGDLQCRADPAERCVQRAVGSTQDVRVAGRGGGEAEEDRIVVVLPAPFGPRNPVTLPVGTEKLSRSTASRWP